MGEMKAVTTEDVKPVYKNLYANKVRFDALLVGLDWAVLDWAVKSGTGSVAKALQKIVGAKQDGAISLKTLQAAADFDAIETIEKLHTTQQKFCEVLLNFKTFSKGWTRRNQESPSREEKWAVSAGEALFPKYFAKHFQACFPSAACKIRQVNLTQD